jgi:hypothetical protein
MIFNGQPASMTAWVKKDHSATSKGITDMEWRTAEAETEVPLRACSESLECMAIEAAKLPLTNGLWS